MRPGLCKIDMTYRNLYLQVTITNKSESNTGKKQTSDWYQWIIVCEIELSDENSVYDIMQCKQKKSNTRRLLCEGMKGHMQFLH